MKQKVVQAVKTQKQHPSLGIRGSVQRVRWSYDVFVPFGCLFRFPICFNVENLEHYYQPLLEALQGISTMFFSGLLGSICSAKMTICSCYKNNDIKSTLFYIDLLLKIICSSTNYCSLYNHKQYYESLVIHRHVVPLAPC